MTILETRGVLKKFGSLEAVDHVDIKLEQGEIHALLGENGAGKTTLIKLINGFHAPDDGEIWYQGKRVRFRTPHEAIPLGIHTIYQDFSLIDTFSVEENLRLAFSLSKTVKDVSKVLSRYGGGLDLRSTVLDLPLGLRQRTEVIKALASNAKVLLLDEPSSVLTDDEKKTLFSDLRSTCDEGVAVLIATHKLQDVVDFCDKVTVMKLGHVVLEKECGQGSVHELASAMVGGQFGGSFEKGQTRELGENVLTAEDLSVSDDRGKVTVKNVSFAVRKGEILGIIGVAGNGQVELAETLSGLRRPMSGKVRVRGDSLYDREGSEHLIGHITDDPAKVGLALNMTVKDNFVCNSLDKFADHAILQDDKMAEFAEGVVKKFGVKTRSLVVPLRYLSGGNIQKVIVGREIMRTPEVLIAEHPTRGLDISATSLVLKELAELALQGSAIVLLAEDVDEVMAVSDKIGVIFEGEILRMDARQNLDKAMIGGLMGGIVAEGSISSSKT